MTVEEQVAAIRASVALSRLDHVCHVRISGTRAYETLDHVAAGQLRVRDGQLLHTILLTDDAFPLADAYVGRDDEDFFLLAEGIEAGALVEHLRRHVPPGESVLVEDRSASHAIVAVDGPYAWELLGAAIDPEVIGLPYLTFYHREGLTCYRAGKTGEYGYGIIVRRDDADALVEHLRAVGSVFDLRDATLDALDHCALENWFFNIRREGRERVTPLELQLQWRVSYRKEYVGAAALRKRRAEGARQRLSCLLADSAIAVGDVVNLAGAPIGRVVNAGFSAARGEWVAQALLDVAWAHPGIHDLAVANARGSAVARTVSPPVLMNRSLSVSPQLHGYLTRHEHPGPPLVRR